MKEKIKLDYKKLIIFLLGINNIKRGKKVEESFKKENEYIQREYTEALKKREEELEKIKEKIKKAKTKREKIRIEKEKNKNYVKVKLPEELISERVDPYGGYTKKEIINSLINVLRSSILSNKINKKNREIIEKKRDKKVRVLRGNLSKRINDLKKDGIIEIKNEENQEVYYLTKEGHEEYNIIKENIKPLLLLYLREASRPFVV